MSLGRRKVGEENKLNIYSNNIEKLLLNCCLFGFWCHFLGTLDEHCRGNFFGILQLASGSISTSLDHDSMGHNVFVECFYVVRNEW